MQITKLPSAPIEILFECALCGAEMPRAEGRRHACTLSKKFAHAERMRRAREQEQREYDERQRQLEHEAVLRGSRPRPGLEDYVADVLKVEAELKEVQERQRYCETCRKRVVPKAEYVGAPGTVAARWGSVHKCEPKLLDVIQHAIDAGKPIESAPDDIAALQQEIAALRAAQDAGK